MRCKNLHLSACAARRRTIFGLQAVLAVIILTGCHFQSPMGTHESEATGSSARDVNNDVLRVYAASAELGGFDYDTMPPVEVSLKFVDASSSPIENVVATLETMSGARVYRAVSDDAGLIETEVRLPSKPEDIKLTVERSGYVARTLVIEDMVRYERIDRVLELTPPEGLVEARGGGMRAALSAADSDGDGVPDKLDDFPYDSKKAFSVTVPAEGMLTVVFEDLYPNFEPQSDPRRDKFFDADFNDFVARYAVKEIKNSQGKLHSIRGSVEAVERLAGYDHQFGMLFRFEDYSATVVVKGPSRGRKMRVRDYADIVLFESSAQIFPRGYRAREQHTVPASFTIRFDEPVPREAVTGAPYDPYIKVHNTGEYIHRIGKEPHPNAPASAGATWQYRHPGNGMPWALIIPQEDWIYPGETVFIEDVYPAFLYWRESFGDHYPDWYTYYREDPGPPVEAEPPPPITAITRDSDGAVLTGDPPSDTVEWPAEETYTLHLEENALAETVYYRSLAPLPVWISLDDEEENIVTVDAHAADLSGGETEDAVVNFYSSYNADPADDDAESATIEEPFEVEFTVWREREEDL